MIRNIQPGTAVFLQVRLDSSRLPRKALLDLQGKPVIQHAMEALKEVPVEVYALLTDADSKDELIPFADQSGFDVFTGPKNDVLERYALAAERYKVHTIIRATGDNPLVSGRCGGDILDLHLHAEADYSGFVGLPLGTGVECIRTGALMQSRTQAQKPYDREHVCPFLYNHPKLFRIYRPGAPAECCASELKVTLDTRDDYERIRQIFDDLYEGVPINTERLINYTRHRCSVTG